MLVVHLIVKPLLTHNEPSLHRMIHDDEFVRIMSIREVISLREAKQLPLELLAQVDVRQFLLLVLLELDVVLNNLTLVEFVFVILFDLAADVRFEASLIGVALLLGDGKLRHLIYDK